VADSFITVCDNAIKAAVFNRWVDLLPISDPGKDIVFWPKDLALRKVAEKRESVMSEFISVWSPSPQRDLEREHTPTSVVGFTIDLADGTTQVLKAVPVSLNYDLTVWSLSKNDVNKVIEDYVWWKYRNPNLSLRLNGIYPLEMDLHFGDIQDESVVIEEYSKGLYFRQTFPVRVDAWSFDIYSVELIEKVELKLLNGVDNTSTYVDVTLEAAG
jgi:hypothetical protein